MVFDRRPRASAGRVPGSRPAGRGPADGLRRSGRGSSARRGRPDLRDRPAARRRCARPPSPSPPRGRPAESSRRRAAPPPGPGPRGKPEASSRSRRPRASPRRLRSPRPAPRRCGSPSPLPVNGRSGRRGRAWPRARARRRRRARARQRPCPAAARRSAAGRCRAPCAAGGNREPRDPRRDGQGIGAVEIGGADDPATGRRRSPTGDGTRASTARRRRSPAVTASAADSSAAAGQRPSDREIRVDQVGRADSLNLVGVDGQRGPMLGLPDPPIAPERGGAQAGGQARQVFLFPAPGRLDPAAVIGPARRPSGPCRAGGRSSARIRCSIAARSVPGAASSWMKNWPARCAAACAVSIQVAGSVGLDQRRARDATAGRRRADRRARPGPERRVAARNGPPAQEAPRRRSDSARTKSRRPDWCGSTISAAARGVARRASAKDLGDPVQGRVGIHVADDDQNGPVGPVVCLVERSQVVDADPRDVFGPAQDRVAIRDDEGK